MWLSTGALVARMIHTVKKRTRLILAVTLFAALLGMAGGFLLFRTIALQLAMVELDHHAWRYMLRAEESSKTSERFLTSMAAAGLPACSDAEIAYMHRLLFQSEYLKDGGRMIDGKVQCDALFRTSELTRRVFTPSFRFGDGTEVYTDIRMVAGDPEARVGVQRGGFFVSYLHWRPDRLGNLPLKFTLTEVDSNSQHPGWLHGEKSDVPFAILAKDGWTRAGGRLYATHCSPRFHNCFTAFIETKAVFATPTHEIASSVFLGGIVGGFVGYFCVLLYGRNQNMAYQLRRAIRADRLRMLYQPIVDAKDRQIVGAEALMRWTDDDGTEVSPEVFVRVAEANGFIGQLTELAVLNVLRDLGDFLRHHPDFSLNLNVTGTDLCEPQFLDMLSQNLLAANLLASSLTIEITESSTAKKKIAVETIHKLRERGHSVYIDDFGTGYSSLSYLHSLAVDAIKIDKSFTRAIGTEAVTLSILPQILEIANTLSLKVVVEGIETEEQADYFAHYAQPILAQGYLFGFPLPPEEFKCQVRDQLSRMVAA